MRRRRAPPRWQPMYATRLYNTYKSFHSISILVSDLFGCTVFTFMESLINWTSTIFSVTTCLVLDLIYLASYSEFQIFPKPHGVGGYCSNFRLPRLIL